MHEFYVTIDCFSTIYFGKHPTGIFKRRRAFYKKGGWSLVNELGGLFVLQGILTYCTFRETFYAIFFGHEHVEKKNEISQRQRESFAICEYVKRNTNSFDVPPLLLRRIKSTSPECFL
ncbi:hypothetical protein BCR42DRAFT_496941 [Absidia repens]|uniref:Uncharacterized protein n=1 Tax=Absidia repens TaxID=90262 RepID=A0A1X2HXL7_9FUNG|nr:hypothetical protein BCR42DRAFT_496941 [Absidia repens]